MGGGHGLATAVAAARLAARDIEDVQLAAGGRLSGELLGRVMGDVVAIDDVVVPVAGAEFESVRALEAEGAAPRPRFGVMVLELGEREL